MKYMLVLISLLLILPEWTQAQILTPNFNGLVHVSEEGQPDAPTGFRSISDRALIIDGTAGALPIDIIGATGLAYSLVGIAGDLDIVHIGNRNTVDNGNWAFDAVADGDTIGIQPDWLLDPDQSTVVNLLTNPIPLNSVSEIGFLYQISNGGGSFDVVLEFSDLTTVTVTLNGPDWFGPGGGTPTPAGAGVAVQQNLVGTFIATNNVDQADTDQDLLVTEAVISAAQLLSDLAFDINGLELTGITFTNTSNAIAGYAIIAATTNITISLPPTPVVPTLNKAGLYLLTLSILLIGWFSRTRIIKAIKH